MQLRSISTTPESIQIITRFLNIIQYRSCHCYSEVIGGSPELGYVCLLNNGLYTIHICERLYFEVRHHMKPTINSFWRFLQANLYRKYVTFKRY